MKVRALRAWLDENLFPEPSPTTRVLPPSQGKRGNLAEAALLVGGLLTLAIVLQLFRPGPSVALNSIWAEDGLVFMQAAWTLDAGDTVFLPYAEYLVLVPRLIAEVASAMPLELVPATISILASAVIALGGLAVWHASAGHIQDPILRGALVVVAVLSPVAGLEAVDSASYVSWYMLFACFWLLLWRPRTMLGAVLGGLFLIATGLSNPGVWLLLPIVVLRAFTIRNRRDLTIVASYAVGAAIQVPVVATHNDQAAEPTWTADIWTAYLQRVLDGSLLGEHLGGLAWSDLGWPFLIALLAAAVAALAFGFWRAGWSGRCLAVIAIVASLALFVITAYQREVGTALMWPDGIHGGASGRYAIVPALLLISAALALIDSAARREGSRRPWLSIGVAAVLGLAVVTSFSVREPEVRGTPPWDQALRDAGNSCVGVVRVAAPIPTSPPGFGVLLPCDRLHAFAAPAAP